MNLIKAYELVELPLNTKASLRGRVVLRRNFGKRVFYSIKDDSGIVQASISRDSFDSEEDYKNMKKSIGLGDIVNLEGGIILSNTRTHTLNVTRGEVLTKCTNSLPDKKKGLNKEGKYTKRGLDLLTDQSALERFRRLNQLRRLIRDYLHSKGYEEVDTGILKTTSDTSMSLEFVTMGNWTSKPLYLRKSTEMRLKQLVVGGLEKIFELGKEFRNEGVSSLFLPEFTALELYGAYLNYRDILALTVGMLESLNSKLGEPSKRPTDFKEVFFYDFIEEETGVDIREAPVEVIRGLITPDILKGYPKHPAMRAFNAYDVFRSILKRYPKDNFVLHGIPLEVSPLAKAYDEEPTLVEEFRYFVHGTSFCGGMTELTDAEEQQRRIIHQAEYLGKTLDDNDSQFIELLRYGLPPCGGLGLSLERLMMLYAETENIKDVVYFPL